MLYVRLSTLASNDHEIIVGTADIKAALEQLLDGYTLKSHSTVVKTVFNEGNFVVKVTKMNVELEKAGDAKKTSFA